jgi:hypothetical protein
MKTSPKMNAKVKLMQRSKNQQTGTNKAIPNCDMLLLRHETKKIVYMIHPGGPRAVSKTCVLAMAVTKFVIVCQCPFHTSGSMSMPTKWTITEFIGVACNNASRFPKLDVSIWDIVNTVQSEHDETPCQGIPFNCGNNKVRAS